MSFGTNLHITHEAYAKNTFPHWRLVSLLYLLSFTDGGKVIIAMKLQYVTKYQKNIYAQNDTNTWQQMSLKSSYCIQKYLYLSVLSNTNKNT